MNDELNELATALQELGEQMSDMTVRRTTSKGQKKGKDTTSARRAARRATRRDAVQVVQVPDAAMSVAKALAGGDMSRVKVQRDGTVVVIN